MSYVQSVKLLLDDLKKMEPSGAMRLGGTLKMTRQAVYAWGAESVTSERYAKSLLRDIVDATRGVEADIHAAARLRLDQGAIFEQGARHAS